MDENIRKNIKAILLQFEDDIEGLLDFFDELNILNPNIVCEGNLLYVPTKDTFDLDMYQEEFTTERIKTDIIDYANHILESAIENEDYEIAQKIKDYFKRINYEN